MDDDGRASAMGMSNQITRPGPYFAEHPYEALPLPSAIQVLLARLAGFAPWVIAAWRFDFHLPRTEQQGTRLLGALFLSACRSIAANDLNWVLQVGLPWGPASRSIAMGTEVLAGALYFGLGYRSWLSALLGGGGLILSYTFDLSLAPGLGQSLFALAHYQPWAIPVMAGLVLGPIRGACIGVGDLLAHRFRRPSPD